MITFVMTVNQSRSGAPSGKKKPVGPRLLDDWLTAGCASSCAQASRGPAGHDLDPVGVEQRRCRGAISQREMLAAQALVGQIGLSSQR